MTHKHAETEKKGVRKTPWLSAWLMEEGASLSYTYVSLWQLILIMKNRRKSKRQRKVKGRKKGGRG